eukprot:jgi/Galph1/277/GphlegSOOS_G5118.1
MDDLSRQLQNALKTAKGQLDRERTILYLEHCLSELEKEQVKELLLLWLQQPMNHSGEWSDIYHSFLTSERILRFVASREAHKVFWMKDSVCESLCLELAEACLEFTVAGEVRLRNLVGTCLADIIAIFKEALFYQVYERLLQKLNEVFLKRLSERQEGTKVVENIDCITEKQSSMLLGHENWKYLETLLETVSQVITQSGKNILQEPHSSELVHILRASAKDPNRFVRESCQHVLFSLLKGIDKPCISSNFDMLDSILDIVALGMEDNWSQVRFASSKSCTELLENVPIARESIYFPLLLPRLRLNCHYSAEGVRSYCLNSWQRVLNQRGHEMMSRLLSQFLEYYTCQTSADNHSVREAACWAIKEAIDKLSMNLLEPFLEKIMNALLNSFHDESWPVRDCASVVCGQVTVKFPTQVQHLFIIEKLQDLWYNSLGDNIPSVRENSSIALAQACEALHDDPALNFDILFQHCQQHLLRVREQPGDSDKYNFFHKRYETQFGVSHKLAHDNDIDIHREQTMYSCGSLAPKLKKGGCLSSYHVDWQKEPWQESDGALRLWRQLMLKQPQKFSELFPIWIQMLEHMNFAKAPYLLETFCSVLSDTVELLERTYLLHYVPCLWSKLQFAKHCGYPLVEKHAKVALQKLERISPPKNWNIAGNDEELFIK